MKPNIFTMHKLFFVVVCFLFFGYQGKSQSNHEWHFHDITTPTVPLEQFPENVRKGTLNGVGNLLRIENNLQIKIIIPPEYRNLKVEPTSGYSKASYSPSDRAVILNSVGDNNFTINYDDTSGKHFERFFFIRTVPYTTVSVNGRIPTAKKKLIIVDNKASAPAPGADEVYVEGSDYLIQGRQNPNNDSWAVTINASFSPIRFDTSEFADPKDIDLDKIGADITVAVLAERIRTHYPDRLRSAQGVQVAALDWAGVDGAFKYVLTPMGQVYTGSPSLSPAFTLIDRRTQDSRPTHLVARADPSSNLRAILEWDYYGSATDWEIHCNDKVVPAQQMKITPTGGHHYRAEISGLTPAENYSFVVSPVAYGRAGAFSEVASCDTGAYAPLNPRILPQSQVGRKFTLEIDCPSLFQEYRINGADLLGTPESLGNKKRFKLRLQEYSKEISISIGYQQNHLGKIEATWSDYATLAVTPLLQPDDVSVLESDRPDAIKLYWLYHVSRLQEPESIPDSWEISDGKRTMKVSPTITTDGSFQQYEVELTGLTLNTTYNQVTLKGIKTNKGVTEITNFPSFQTGTVPTVSNIKEDTSKKYVDAVTLIYDDHGGSTGGKKLYLVNGKEWPWDDVLSDTDFHEPGKEKTIITNLVPGKSYRIQIIYEWTRNHHPNIAPAEISVSTKPLVIETQKVQSMNAGNNTANVHIDWSYNTSDFYDMLYFDKIKWKFYKDGVLLPQSEFRFSDEAKKWLEVYNLKGSTTYRIKIEWNYAGGSGSKEESITTVAIADPNSGSTGGGSASGSSGGSSSGSGSSSGDSSGSTGGGSGSGTGGGTVVVQPYPTTPPTPAPLPAPEGLNLHKKYQRELILRWIRKAEHANYHWNINGVKVEPQQVEENHQLYWEVQLFDLLPGEHYSLELSYEDANQTHSESASIDVETLALTQTTVLGKQVYLPHLAEIERLQKEIPLPKAHFLSYYLTQPCIS